MSREFTDLTEVAIFTQVFAWRGFEDSIIFTIPKYTELQSIAGVMEYLNQNAPKDCVVYASREADQINRFVGAFTSCNIYSSFSLFVYGVPDDRIMHNFLVDLRLRGIKPKDLKKYLDENAPLIRSQFFIDWNELFCCEEQPWFKEFINMKEIDQHLVDVKKNIEKKYAVFLRGDFYSELTRYRLDYFIVDTEKEPQINEKNFPFLSFKYKSGKFVIYSVIKPYNLLK